MYPYNAQWLDTYATQKPMRVPAKTYTNESSTAQSRPQFPASMYTRVGVTSKVAIEGANAKPSVGPSNPAAPDPKTTAQDTNTKAVKNPLMWLGLAAGVFTLFWLVRHA